MKVQVLSHYDTVETVNVRDLRRLIAAGEVLAFRRSSGWVKAAETMTDRSVATSGRSRLMKNSRRAGIIA